MLTVEQLIHGIKINHNYCCTTESKNNVNMTGNFRNVARNTFNLMDNAFDITLFTIIIGYFIVQTNSTLLLTRFVLKSKLK